MHPDDQKMIIGVLIMLADDLIRGAGKFDLVLPTDDGKSTWGFAEGRAWIAFVEEDDGSITIVHVSLQSRFRPPRLPPYGFDRGNDID